MSSIQISSAQNPIIKHWIRLRDKKSYRNQNQKVLISGETLILELAKHLSFSHLIALQKSSPPEGLKAEKICFVTKEIMKKITALDPPPSLAAELAMPTPSDLQDKTKILVLDQISDPGNMGTLIRSALAFSWDGVYIVENSCDPFNDKALRAAKGATFFLPFSPISSETLQQLIEKKTFHAYVADSKGTPFTDASHKTPLMLILGNEAKGVRPEIKKRCTSLGIPIAKQTESLNVAVAGGILMHGLQS